MLNPEYNVVKTALENLKRDSQVLLARGAPVSIAMLDGVEHQCKLGKEKTGVPVGLIYIGLLTENGYDFRTYAVEWKHALNLVRTIKSTQ